jgi:plastocyanin
MRTIIDVRPRLALIAFAAAALAGTAILFAVNPPLSSAGGAPNQTTVRAVGGYKFEPNRSFQDRQRFAPGVSAVQSGGRVTFVNRTREGHSFSLVRRGQLPDNAREYFGCYGPNGACGSLLEAHRFDDNSDQNDRFEVNAGQNGFDRAGDSVALLPDRRTTEMVSAPAGRNLYLLCIFHPQMQATIRSR